MTEKQIEQLKSLLAESSLALELDESSKELDARLIKAAYERQPDASKASNFSLLALFGTPFTLLGTVTLAAVFTAVLFLGMSQMIVPEERTMAVNSDVEFSEGKLVTKQIKVRDLVSRPEPRSIENAPSKVSRDRILMDFNLPAASELLANIEFDPEHDRVAAKESINVAMREISVMIELGTFDSARERYALLLEFCESCSLPTSLEALVLSSISNSSGTG